QLMDVTLNVQPFAVPRMQASNTLYFAGAAMFEFDGTFGVEHGTLLYPENVTTAQSAGGSLTTLATYSYRVYYEVLNAQGVVWRSTALPFNITLTGTNQTVTVTAPTLAHTQRKASSGASDTVVSIVVYRTQANPSATPVYYRVSNPSPAVTGTN